jgi:hypothetical protein
MCIPLSYNISHDKGKEGLSATVNISRGGLLFSAKKPAPINTRIIVKMPFQQKTFKIRARVIHCVRTTETGLYNIGICFEKFSDAFKVKLIEQMYLILEYRDLRSIQLGKDISLQQASKEWIKRYSERFKRLYW